jgi:hypothetical protein
MHRSSSSLQENKYTPLRLVSSNLHGFPYDLQRKFTRRAACNLLLSVVVDGEVALGLALVADNVADADKCGAAAGAFHENRRARALQSKWDVSHRWQCAIVRMELPLAEANDEGTRGHRHLFTIEQRVESTMCVCVCVLDAQACSERCLACRNHLSKVFRASLPESFTNHTDVVPPDAVRTVRYTGRAAPLGTFTLARLT